MREIFNYAAVLAVPVAMAGVYMFNQFFKRQEAREEAALKARLTARTEPVWDVKF